MLEWLDDDLRALAERGRLRALRPRSGIDFTSNDYLGLAESDELQRAAVDALGRGVPIGSGGSPQGRGLAAPFEGRDNVITLHTCGKALGTVGGFVLAPRRIREFLINRARPFIFANAPSPLSAAVTRVAINISATDPARRDRLARLVDYAGRELRRCCRVEPSGSQIIPVIVGADRAAVALADSLQRRGFDVRAIRPPTVAEGTARLRIAITLNVDEAMVTQLFEALGAELRQAA